jgi:spermidine/putrescine ABC transporter ATP-binding subunit
MSDYMIEFVNVTKRYGDIVANEHITLQIKRGELMTLLGPSGCGKTTALRCLTGHNRPDEGRILIDGQDVTDLPTYKRNLGMVFQNFALFPHMTAFENVEFPLRIRGLSQSKRREKVMEALKLVRLEGFGSHFPRQLSGGQQQRIGLARALVYRPSVLLLDEPLSNLDAKLREGMRFEIKDLQVRLGITAVYVTHDQEEAQALSDRVAIMNRGRIEQVGTPEEIYERPGSQFVADFIGLSNFLEGTVTAVEGETTYLAVDNLSLGVATIAGAWVGQRVLAFVRPNEVELAAPGAMSGPEVLEGVVEKTTYLGDKVDYRLRLGDRLMLRVQSGGMVRFKPGEHVAVRLPIGRCRVISGGKP